MRRILGLFALMMLGACDGGPGVSSRGEGVPGKLLGPGDARVLALGDSYTIGESVSPAERFPNQAVRMLRKRGMKGLPEPAVLARTGWTVEELMGAMDGEKFAPKYECVMVLIGVNNEFRGGTAEEFRGPFVKLLDRATRLAGGEARRVVVVSIPDWGVTPMNEQMGRAGVSAEIDAFNGVCRGEAEARKMAFVEVTDISRRMPEDSSLVAQDGLHPSEKQYGLWAERIAPVVEAVLRR